MKNIKLIMVFLLALGIILSFSTNKQAVATKMANEKAAMVKLTDEYALEALSKSKSIVNSKKSDKADLRSAIYHLSEAAMSSNPQVQTETSALLQTAVKKLQKLDPEGYNLNIYYKYLDDIEIFVKDYNLNQPFIVATNAKGEEENYPYLIKGDLFTRDVSSALGQLAHVIELEIPGTKEKTRLYIDYLDYQHSELPAQKGHQHYIIPPVK